MSVPPIIDAAEFEAVQALLKTRSHVAELRKRAAEAEAKLKRLYSLLRPRGFEPLTFAFGG